MRSLLRAPLQTPLVLFVLNGAKPPVLRPSAPSAHMFTTGSPGGGGRRGALVLGGAAVVGGGAYFAYSKALPFGSPSGAAHMSSTPVGAAYGGEETWDGGIDTIKGVPGCSGDLFLAPEDANPPAGALLPLPPALQNTHLFGLGGGDPGSKKQSDEENKRANERLRVDLEALRKGGGERAPDAVWASVGCQAFHPSPHLIQGRSVERAAMHSYVEQVTYLPGYAMEERRAAEQRPMRKQVAAASFAALACVAVLVVASDMGVGGGATELVPKFVDWKKEDAGSDDMNLHLKVADALAKADGLAETGLSPVPEGLLKEAQQAAEEQKTMPGVLGKVKKPEISSSLEKMFKQAMDEQHVEKLAKEGGKAAKKAQAAQAADAKKAAVKKAAAAKLHEQHAKLAEAKEEKAESLNLLKAVSAPAVPAAAPAAATPPAAQSAPAPAVAAAAAPAVVAKKAL